VVAQNLDVRGDEVGDRGIGPAEHDVLPCTLDVVVHDAERSGAVETGDCLRIVVDGFDVRDVAVENVGADGVEGDAALLALQGMSVNVDAVHHDVVRGCGGRVLAERNQRLVSEVRRPVHFEELQRVMVSAGLRGDDRRRDQRSAAADEPRQQFAAGVAARPVNRNEPYAICRQRRVRRIAPDRDPRGRRRFRAQNERPGEGLPCRQEDRVAWRGGIDRGLQRRELTAQGTDSQLRRICAGGTRNRHE
jgi:hypothetical protein